MGTKVSKVRLRDQRRPGWCWAENELLDVFLPMIGPNGVTLYMALCRSARGSEVKDLSLRDLGTLSGMSKDSVQRTMAKMVALGMASERRGEKSKTKSTYDLLDLKDAAAPGIEELQRRLSVSVGDRLKTLKATKKTTAEAPKSVSVGDRNLSQSVAPAETDLSHSCETDLSQTGDSYQYLEKLRLKTNTLPTLLKEGIEKSLVSLLSGIASLTPKAGDPSDLLAQVEEYMDAHGFSTEREHKISNRGDGRPGQVDLFCTRGDMRVAIQLDDRTARERSLSKLKTLDVHRVVILRTAPQSVSYVGIDTVIAMNWPGNGFVPATQARRNADIKRALIGSYQPAPVTAAVRRPVGPHSSATVRTAVREALVGVRSDLEAMDSPENKYLVEAIAAWDSAFENVSYENHESYEGATEGLSVRISSPQVKATAAAISRHPHRIEERLQKLLGCLVSLQVVGTEGVSA